MALTARVCLSRVHAHLCSNNSSHFIAKRHLCVLCVKSFDMEQRAVIKFYFKWGKTAVDVHLDLKNVYSAQIMRKATGGMHVFMAENR